MEAASARRDSTVRDSLARSAAADADAEAPGLSGWGGATSSGRGGVTADLPVEAAAPASVETAAAACFRHLFGRHARAGVVSEPSGDTPRGKEGGGDPKMESIKMKGYLPLLGEVVFV